MARTRKTRAEATPETVTPIAALPAPDYKYRTREEWLEAAVRELRNLFRAEAKISLPPVRVSVGWPGGSGSKNHVIGQCWATHASADSVAQVFISPVLDNGMRVLDVLAHELTHAADDCNSGHMGAFWRIGKAVGLAGKPTATVASPRLQMYLADVIRRIGAYPHAALVDTQYGRIQGTRLLKVTCRYGANDEGETYKLRMTAKWILQDGYGTPICPCHEETMIAEF
jgi:hypothetical protein